LRSDHRRFRAGRNGGQGDLVEQLQGGPKMIHEKPGNGGALVYPDRKLARRRGAVGVENGGVPADGVCPGGRAA